MEQVPKELEPKIEKLSNLFNEFNKELNSIMAPGRCGSLCNTKLSEAYFWAMQSFTDPTAQVQQPSTILKPQNVIRGTVTK